MQLAGFEIDRFARKLAFGLGRRRHERALRRDVGPNRLDHRLKDRHGDVAAGRAATEGVALAVGVVVADPDRNGDVIGLSHEPGIVLLVGGPGLPRDIGCKSRDRARRPPRQHTLQHGFKLIERGVID